MSDQRPVQIEFTIVSEFQEYFRKKLGFRNEWTFNSQGNLNNFL